MKNSKKSNEARSSTVPAEGSDNILPPNADKASSKQPPIGAAKHKQQTGRDKG